MINPELHTQPIALDRVGHRTLKLSERANSLTRVKQLNSMFVTLAEFGDAAKEFPIFFLRAGKDEKGNELVAPVAVFGLKQGQNLFLAGEGADTRWTARYTPALMRAYPFTMARVSEDQMAVCIDQSFDGWSQTEGRALFDEQGEPTELLNNARDFVERVEAEVERTRFAGQRLMELKLLQEKRFDATLPDGSPLRVDGFLALDEERFNKLSDAEALELHRSGLAGVLHAHLISMANMTALIERQLTQTQGGATA
ncbi:SapC family protein [Ideonella sp.]|jgi:hypothetical protein|uniref:SapC family protein n=1 Tax=Ideonella sp. TaxID=1929293 RepID=UPI0037C03096